MKKYIKPEMEVIEIQSEGFLASSTFQADGDVNGPAGVPSRESSSDWNTFTSDDIWGLDED